MQKNVSPIKNRIASGHTFDEIRASAEQYANQIRDRALEVDQKVRENVSHRPLTFLAGAFAAGYLISRAVRAWRTRDS